MSATQKNLQYYLEHLDEMPTDPAELDRLANEQLAATGALETEEMTVERIVGEPEAKAEGDPKADPEPPKVEEPKETPKEAPKEEPKAAESEVKPEGVLAKDGKNVIPYAVLASERQRREAAERLVADKEREIEALKASKPKAEEPKTEILSDEELAALEGESPTLAKVLRAQQSTIQTLTGTVATLKGSVEHREATEAAEVKSEIQLAIDAVPELAAWQAAEDQTAWNIAASYDKTLRALPKYREVPFEDRFKKAVELTKATLAEQSAETLAKPEVKAPTAEEVRAVAEAKLKAKSAQSMPRSLSDIPGGAPPAVDERGRVEDMSTIELGNILLGMTQEQQDAWIAGL